jgi:hypothetical protein
MFTIQAKDPAILRGEKDGSYRSAFGLSQSAFKEFFVSPKHYLQSTEEKKKPSDDMIFGTCFHSLMLDEKPCYAVREKLDMRKTDDKKKAADWEIANKGLIPMTEDDERDLRGMREAILTGNSIIKELYLTSKELEICLFATAVTDSGEVRLKGMLDGYDPKTKTIWDFKKVGKKATAYEFEKTIRERMYWVQAVHYTWLAMANGLEVDRFVFGAVEDKAPYGHAAFTFDINKKMKYSNLSALQNWEHALHEFGSCQESGNWYGYPDFIQELSI